MNQTKNIVDESRIYAFTRKFGAKSPHFWLACHASFPPALTSDLLYKIWLNFQEYELDPVTQKIENLYVPLTAVGEILASPICREIGYDLYEIYPSIRAEFTRALIENDLLGHKRALKIAHFLKAYKDFNAEKIPTSAFKESLSLIADSYLNPSKAAQRILDLFNKAQKQQIKGSHLDVTLSWVNSRNQIVRNKKPDLITKDPLLIAETLIESVRKMHLGKKEEALKELNPLKSFLEENLEDKKGFKTLLPTEVFKALEIEIEEEDSLTEVETEILRRIEESRKSKILDLSGLDLIEIPVEVANCDWIFTLDISENKIEKLPNFLFEFNQLIELSLHNNHVQNILDEIERLENLKKLRIGHNNFEVINNKIGNLDKLTHLYLNGNNLNHLPEFLAKLDLSFLDLSDNNLTELPPYLFEFSNINEVSLEKADDDNNNILYLKGNAVTSPPMDILSQGMGAVRRYFNPKSSESKLIELRKKAKEALSEGDTNGAIRLIKDLLLNSSDKNNELILLEGRYNKVKRDVIQGIIESERADVSFSQITHQLLEFINGLEESDLEKLKESSSVKDTNGLKQKLIDLLVKNKLNDAFRLIKDLLPSSSEKYSELIILEGRSKKVRRDFNRGIIDLESQDVSLNQTREMLLQFINGLEESDFDLENFDNSESENRTGYLVYSIPEKMVKNEETKCQVRIAYDEEKLMEEFDSDESSSNKSSIRISEVMGIEFLEDKDKSALPFFDVRSLSSTEQVIEEQDFTEWNFYVKPTEIGKASLLLKITIISISNGREINRVSVKEIEVTIIEKEKSFGFQPDFLSEELLIKGPILNDSILEKATVKDSEDHILHYPNYSIVHNAKRKFAFYSAANFDGSQYIKIKRDDRWRKENRIKNDEQHGMELYRRRGLDRRNLTDRSLVMWGDNEKAIEASNSVNVFTNCIPLHPNVNRKYWRECQDYVSDIFIETKKKACVFTGPIFNESDPLLSTEENIQIPCFIWRMIYYLNTENELCRMSFLMGQYSFLEEDELIQSSNNTFKPFDDFEDGKLYQVPSSFIEELTKMKFTNAKDVFEEPLFEGLNRIVKKEISGKRPPAPKNLKPLYALLVGIDEYSLESNVPPLNNCLNDVSLVQDYLNQRYRNADVPVRIKTLLNEEATRDNVIRGFDIFEDAKEDAVCLFYFSGHGSIESSPPELLHWTRNGDLSTIVCYDSRDKGSFDLSEVELSWLIWKSTYESDKHFVSILDSCHAGSNTRSSSDSIKDKIILDRKTNTNREISSYLGFNDFSMKDSSLGKEYTPKVGKAIELASTAQNQTSKILKVNQKSYGVFTYSLINILNESIPELSYTDLLRKLKNKVKLKVKDQTPQITTSNDQTMNSVFLDGTLLNALKKFFISFDREERAWMLNAGESQGIFVTDSKNGTTLVLEDGNEVIVTKTFPNKSIVEGNFGMSVNAQYTVSIKEQSGGSNSDFIESSRFVIPSSVWSVLMLSPEDTSKKSIQEDFNQIYNGDANITPQTMAEISIMGIQRLLIFLNYSTSSSGGYIIDGDFGRGTNRGIAQFLFERGMAPENITRSVLGYDCNFQTARKNIIEIPEVKLTGEILQLMMDEAQKNIDENEVLGGDFEYALFQLNAIHNGESLNCQSILNQYGEAAELAANQLIEEKEIIIHPEWILAIIRQETAGIPVPRFEQHLLSKYIKEARKTDFSELRYQSTSFGLGRIMGFNFGKVGAESGKELFYSTIKEQVMQIARFLTLSRKTRPIVALLNPTGEDFKNVARYYNGSGYEKHHYDESLARWFKEFNVLMRSDKNEEEE